MRLRLRNNFQRATEELPCDLQFNLYLSSIYYLTFNEAKAVVSEINPIFWNKNYIYFNGFLA